MTPPLRQSEAARCALCGLAIAEDAYRSWTGDGDLCAACTVGLVVHERDTALACILRLESTGAVNAVAGPLKAENERLRDLLSARPEAFAKTTGEALRERDEALALFADRQQRLERALGEVVRLRIALEKIAGPTATVFTPALIAREVLDVPGGDDVAQS